MLVKLTTESYEWKKKALNESVIEGDRRNMLDSIERIITIIFVIFYIFVAIYSLVNIKTVSQYIFGIHFSMNFEFDI